MDQELILKMAQLQTVLDCINLLSHLHPVCNAEDQKRIDEMVLRLSNMGQSLAP